MKLEKFWYGVGAPEGDPTNPPLVCNETHNMVLAETCQNASNLVLQDQHERSNFK